MLLCCDFFFPLPLSFYFLSNYLKKKMFKLDAVVVFLDALECQSFFKSAFKARLYFERDGTNTTYMSWEKATKSTILNSPNV
jgi:hypothetical protein